MEFPEFIFGDNSQQNYLNPEDSQKFNHASDYPQYQYNNSQNSSNQQNDNQMSEEYNSQECSHIDLVCKDFECVPINLKIFKNVRSFEFFQLQCDCLIDIDFFERSQDLSYWQEKQHCMYIVRPIRKVFHYDKFHAYVFDTSITGLSDFEMPIQRLYQTQNQQAYDLARVLEQAQKFFSQFNTLNTRLRSIFSLNYMKEKLDTNYEKSIEMAKNIANELDQNGQDYFILIILRVCPESLTYKISMVMSSNKFARLMSCDDIDYLYKLALKQCLPYNFDVQSVINMCQTMLHQYVKLQINVSTLDQEMIPCELESFKQPLSSCEISQGIFLHDICVTQKYNINPKLLKSISQNRAQNQMKYHFLDDENIQAQVDRFKQKFYKNENIQQKQQLQQQCFSDDQLETKCTKNISTSIYL